MVNDDELERDLAELEAADPAAREAAGRLKETSASILSTAAQLRQTQRDLAASQADLTQACVERDWLLAEAPDELRERYFAIPRKDSPRRPTIHLDLVRAELASARTELAALDVENDRLGQLVKQAAERLDDITEARRWQVARQDAGPCLMCGLPMVRSQAVKPVPSTTKGTWMHVECPDASAFRWVAARDGQPEGEVLLHLRRPTPTDPEETS